MEKGDIKLTITAASPEIIDAVAKRVIEMLNVNHEVVKIKTEPTFSVKEVARLRGKTSQTIGAHIRKGILPATKVGRDYEIKETDLKNYLDGK